MEIGAGRGGSVLERRNNAIGICGADLHDAKITTYG
jgi:hypothetical protein